MVGSIFEQIAFEIGANDGVPYILFIVQNNSYNMLSMLEDSNVLSLIYWVRDFSGVLFVFNAIFEIVTGIPQVIHGTMKLNNWIYMKGD